jgi:hypothetical protein
MPDKTFYKRILNFTELVTVVIWLVLIKNFFNLQRPSTNNKSPK